MVSVVNKMLYETKTNHKECFKQKKRKDKIKKIEAEISRNWKEKSLWIEIKPNKYHAARSFEKMVPQQCVVRYTYTVLYSAINESSTCGSRSSRIVHILALGD